MKNRLQRIIFFTTQNNTTKIQRILQITQFHFERKDPLLIIVPNEKALHYIDKLLWQEPKESFLPHSISDTPTEELVVITQKQKNLNNASHIFNLSPCALVIEDLHHIIYDFDDISTPEKTNLSREKYQKYKELNFIIEAR